MKTPEPAAGYLRSLLRYVRPVTTASAVATIFLNFFGPEMDTFYHSMTGGSYFEGVKSLLIMW
jgi:hypothetical protein